MKTLAEVIGAHPFFAGMARSHLEVIEGCGRNFRLEEGQVLFHADQQADRFYLLREGRVGIRLPIPGKAPLTVQTVEAGDILGWSWIFPPFRTYFDAVCVEGGRAVEFDGSCLRLKCEADPALGYELTRRFARVMRDRLRATHLQLVDMYKSPVA